MFTQISGATSIDSLATDFGQAVNNPAVKGIVLEIDSPGGMVAGVSEFAAQIRAATKIKPVVAYVSDTGASAAYWIASAASELVIRDTAAVGSIGTVMQTMRGGNDGSIKFVSSQSPFKQANPDSEAGQRLYQAHVDALAQVFIESVAAYRGVTPEKVQSDFGQGAMRVGAAAVAAGMADRLGSLESIIAGLAGDTRKRAFAMNITRDIIAAEHPAIADAFRAEGAAGVVLTVDSIKASHPALVAAILAEGATAERARIQGVQGAALPGYEKDIEAMMFDGVTSAEGAAVKILGLEKAARAGQLAGTRADAAPLAAVAALQPAPSAGPVVDASKLPLEERCKAEYEADASIRADFPTLTSYIADQRALANGSLKVIGAKR
jgi:ClpP class serine protease